MKKNDYYEVKLMKVQSGSKHLAYKSVKKHLQAIISSDIVI